MKKTSLLFVFLLSLSMVYSTLYHAANFLVFPSDISAQQAIWKGPKEDPSFRKAPYLLYPGNNTEMLILWQMDNTVTCLLEWGSDTTYSEPSITTTEFGNDHQHKTLLSGLSPDAKYYYKVSAGTENIKTGSFYTGAEDAGESISFYAYGDTRSNPDIHDLVMKALMDDLEEHPEMQRFIISSGDLVSDGNKEAEWDAQYFDPGRTFIQQMLGSLPSVDAVGNHEGQGILFKKYFPYPMFETERFYYSFDNGPAHFTVLDQFTNYAVGSPQYEWLVNDLAETNKAWKFILLHEPGWSAGGHSNSSEVQNRIQPLCIEYGVQFVITGHNHYYARADVDGIFHITTGGGGAPLYTPNPDYPQIVKVSKKNHFCKIEIDGDSLFFTAVDKDGTVIEAFWTSRIIDGVKENREDYADYFKVFFDGKQIQLINEKSIPAAFSIFDNWGRKVYESKLGMQKSKAGIDGRGIYFVRISFDGKQIVKKLLIQ